MIITVSEFLNASGLPVSDEIDDKKIERAIFTAEQFIVKPRLGDKNYIDIINTPLQFTTILNGGIITEEDEHHNIKYIYLSGLKRAMYELSFAMLLRDNLTSTTFGSVLKKDDYSDQASEERLNAVARYHTEIGMAYLKEITDYWKIDNSGKNLNNWFEELL